MINRRNISQHLFYCSRSLSNSARLIFNHTFKTVNIFCNFCYRSRGLIYRINLIINLFTHTFYIRKNFCNGTCCTINTFLQVNFYISKIIFRSFYITYNSMKLFHKLVKAINKMTNFIAAASLKTMGKVCISFCNSVYSSVYNFYRFYNRRRNDYAYYYRNNQSNNSHYNNKINIMLKLCKYCRAASNSNQKPACIFINNCTSNIVSTSCSCFKENFRSIYFVFVVGQITIFIKKLCILNLACIFISKIITICIN